MVDGTTSLWEDDCSSTFEPTSGRSSVIDYSSSSSSILSKIIIKHAISNPSDNKKKSLILTWRTKCLMGDRILNRCILHRYRMNVGTSRHRHYWLILCCKVSSVLLSWREESLYVVLLNHWAPMDWHADDSWKRLFLFYTHIHIERTVTSCWDKWVLKLGLEIRNTTSSQFTEAANTWLSDSIRLQKTWCS